MSVEIQYDLLEAVLDSTRDEARTIDTITERTIEPEFMDSLMDQIINLKTESNSLTELFEEKGDANSDAELIALLQAQAQVFIKMSACCSLMSTLYLQLGEAYGMDRGDALSSPQRRLN